MRDVDSYSKQQKETTRNLTGYEDLNTGERETTKRNYKISSIGFLLRGTRTEETTKRNYKLVNPESFSVKYSRKQQKETTSHLGGGVQKVHHMA